MTLSEYRLLEADLQTMHLKYGDITDPRPAEFAYLGALEHIRAAPPGSRARSKLLSYAAANFAAFCAEVLHDIPRAHEVARDAIEELHIEERAKDIPSAWGHT